MSDEEKTADTDSSANVSSEPAPETVKKKPSHRKPVWVCIPLTHSETSVDDISDDVSGDSDDGIIDASYVVREPATWSITKCPGGQGQTAAIRGVLTKHKIDPTNYSDVLMFRADPLEFKIDNQIIVRF